MLAQDKLKTYLSLTILGAAVWLMHGFIPALLWATVIAVATWPLRVKIAQRTKLGDIGVATIMTLSAAILLFFPIIYALLLAASDLGALTSWIIEVQKIGIAVPDWLHMIPKVSDQAIKWWEANLTNPASLTVFLGNVDNAWLKEFAQILGVQAAH